MTPNRSPAVYELEREIALLPVEDKLWLQAQIDRQIKSALTIVNLLLLD
jgi:hypothetical protein